MCGICGYISNKKYNDQLLVEMNDTMIHRGPDDSGIYFSDISANFYIGMAHRRLSILDLSEKGHQPMFDDSKNIAIVFNGEIYNYKEIREELKEKGFTFSSKCDTEVIIKAYLAYDINFLDKLNGMFSIALFDKRKQKLILVRDRIGIKPLYYYYYHGVLIFGSELKPLMRHPEFKKDIRTEIISRYLCYKFINAPDTIFENTYKVRPGECVVWQNETVKKFLYWDILEKYENGKRNQINDFQQVKQELKKLLYDSISKRLIADVPVGTFLSGGIDSALITAITQDIVKKPINTFTIGFDTKKENEAVYAKQVARQIGTNHTELYISDKDLLGMLDELPKYYDEPFADSSQIPTMLLSKLAKADVTVALAGDGGDELYCGYPMYEWAAKAQKLDSLGNLAFQLLNFPGIKGLGLLDRLPDKAYAFIKSRSNETKMQMFTLVRERQTIEMVAKESITALYDFEKDINADNWQIKRMLLDMKSYLPDEILAKTDRASMKYSLEVRCPIIDYRIIEQSFRIPHNYKYNNGQKKYILKDILYEMVPKGLLDRPKKGFGVPLALWMRVTLRKELMKFAEPSKLNKQGIFNSDKIYFLIRMLDKSDKSVYNSLLWSFYIFQLWYQEYIEDLWGK